MICNQILTLLLMLPGAIASVFIIIEKWPRRDSTGK